MWVERVKPRVLVQRWNPDYSRSVIFLPLFLPCSPFLVMFFPRDIHIIMNFVFVMDCTLHSKWSVLLLICMLFHHDQFQSNDRRLPHTTWSSTWYFTIACYWTAEAQLWEITWHTKCIIGDIDRWGLECGIFDKRTDNAIGRIGTLPFISNESMKSWNINLENSWRYTDTKV